LGIIQSMMQIKITFVFNLGTLSGIFFSWLLLLILFIDNRQVNPSIGLSFFHHVYFFNHHPTNIASKITNIKNFNFLREYHD
jgi:hypothetical protein